MSLHGELTTALTEHSATLAQLAGEIDKKSKTEQIVSALHHNSDRVSILANSLDRLGMMPSPVQTFPTIDNLESAMAETWAIGNPDGQSAIGNGSMCNCGMWQWGWRNRQWTM